PENYDFRGSWDSEKYAMQIFTNGSGFVDIKRRGRCEGKVWVKGDKLVFQSENEDDDVCYKRFQIDESPTTDTLGVTYMVLDGHRLVKQ
ncbi:MAG TPA: hypothetical protein VFO54_00925, partial [Chryseosolibacter sp.]|nr:hypothetical protein [Chryseosolibacter sp.]